MSEIQSQKNNLYGKQLFNQDTLTAASSTASTFSKKNQVQGIITEQKKQQYPLPAIDEINSIYQEIIFEDSDNDAVLNVDPLRYIQDRERQRLNSTQIFLRKHAAVIKKNLLIEAINYSLRKKHQASKVEQVRDTGNKNVNKNLSGSTTNVLVQQVTASLTQGDLAFERDMKILLEEYSLVDQQQNDAENVDIQEQLLNFPEGKLLTIYANPLLIEYFSENFPLIYQLDNLKNLINQEWQQTEEVKPCFYKYEMSGITTSAYYTNQANPTDLATLDDFSSNQYPQFCWHKCKRLLPIKILESQAQSILQKKQDQGAENGSTSSLIQTNTKTQMFFGISPFLLNESDPAIAAEFGQQTQNYINEALRIVKESKGVGLKNSIQNGAQNSNNLKYLAGSITSALSLNKTDISSRQSTSIQDAAAILEMLPKKKGRRPNYIKELIEQQSKLLAQAKSKNEKKQQENNLIFKKDSGTATTAQNSNLMEDQKSYTQDINPVKKQKHQRTQQAINLCDCQFKENQSDVGSIQHPMKKRDEKKEILLTCSYCQACYHLSCLIGNPLWNKDLSYLLRNPVQSSSSSKFTILGKRSNKEADFNITSATTNIEDSNDETQSVFSSSSSDTKFFEAPKFKSPLSFNNQMMIHDKQYVSKFLDRISYCEPQKSLRQKWACKNCLLGFVRDQLATSNGDLKFAQEIEQSQFIIIQNCIDDGESTTLNQ